MTNFDDQSLLTPSGILASSSSWLAWTIPLDLRDGRSRGSAIRDRRDGSGVPGVSGVTGVSAPLDGVVVPFASLPLTARILRQRSRAAMTAVKQDSEADPWFFKAAK